MKELSLRPYNGRLFMTRTIKDYESSYRRLFKTPDVIRCDVNGKFCGGEGNDGMWTYIVYAKATPQLAHELSHVILHVFERCGIDPIEAKGEPFCYMLSQLMMDAGK